MSTPTATPTPYTNTNSAPGSHYPYNQPPSGNLTSTSTQSLMNATTSQLPYRPHHRHADAGAAYTANPRSAVNDPFRKTAQDSMNNDGREQSYQGGGQAWKQQQQPPPSNDPNPGPSTQSPANIYQHAQQQVHAAAAAQQAQQLQTDQMVEQARYQRLLQEIQQQQQQQQHQAPGLEQGTTLRAELERAQQELRMLKAWNTTVEEENAGLKKKVGELEGRSLM